MTYSRASSSNRPNRVKVDARPRRSPARSAVRRDGQRHRGQVNGSVGASRSVTSGPRGPSRTRRPRPPAPRARARLPDAFLVRPSAAMPPAPIPATSAVTRSWAARRPGCRRAGQAHRPEDGSRSWMGREEGERVNTNGRNASPNAMADRPAGRWRSRSPPRSRGDVASRRAPARGSTAGSRATSTGRERLPPAAAPAVSGHRDQPLTAPAVGLARSTSATRTRGAEGPSR